MFISCYVRVYLNDCRPYDMNYLQSYKAYTFNRMFLQDLYCTFSMERSAKRKQWLGRSTPQRQSSVTSPITTRSSRHKSSFNKHKCINYNVTVYKQSHRKISPDIKLK